MDSKTCIKCGETRKLSGFYISKRPYGIYYERICKICRNTRSNILHRKTYFKGKYKKSQSKYLSGEKWKTRRKELRILNRDKEIARSKFHSALKSGKMVRKPCEVCGDKKTDGHHTDYKKPLQIVWLCRKHHAEAHRIKYSDEAVKNSLKQYKHPNIYKTHCPSGHEYSGKNLAIYRSKQGRLSRRCRICINKYYAKNTCINQKE